MTISRPTRASAPVLALALVLGLGACGTSNDNTSTPSGDASPSASATTPTGTPPPETAPPTDDDPTTEEPTVIKPTDGSALPTGPVPTDILAQDEVKAAIADLAKRESVEPDQVTVAGYFSVTWRDGSIGCPKPGMMYTQALVPGHLMVLEVDDALYSYHAGNKGTFNYCANPTLPAIDEAM